MAWGAEEENSKPLKGKKQDERSGQQLFTPRGGS